MEIEHTMNLINMIVNRPDPDFLSPGMYQVTAGTNIAVFYIQMY